jgi:hypothetical protein
MIHSLLEECQAESDSVSGRICCAARNMKWRLAITASLPLLLLVASAEADGTHEERLIEAMKCGQNGAGPTTRAPNSWDSFND